MNLKNWKFGNLSAPAMGKLFALSLALIWAVGCGIPEDKHNAVLKDLENTKIELANSQQSEEDLSSEIEDLNARISELEAVEKDLSAKLEEAQGTLQMYESKHGTMEERLKATKDELEELREARAQTKERLAQFRDIANKFASMVEAGKLSVKIRDGKMVVELTSNVLFDTGSTRVKEEGINALTELSDVLKQIEKREFLVAGHTDNVGKQESNWTLSTERAVEVVKYLQAAGVDPTKLAAAGYGQFAPVASNETDEGKSLNRRIEIIMMPNLDELPTIPEDIVDDNS